MSAHEPRGVIGETGATAMMVMGSVSMDDTAVSSRVTTLTERDLA